MANVQNSSHDWAWTTLIQSLQNDIVRLHDTVENLRRETGDARERHREELDDLIEQLRRVRVELDPILTERQAAQKARREIVWGWVGRGGWILIAGVAFTIWHYISKHVHIGAE